MEQRRRGSWLSERQIANAVRRDRQVQFIFLSERTVSVSGWVAGWDDYHWFVVTPGSTACRQLLIHKSSVYIDLSAGDAPMPEDVLQIVQPFKDWVLQNYFGQQEAVAS